MLRRYAVEVLTPVRRQGRGTRKLGVTSVVVTHEMDSAFRIADRMVLLDRGKFIVSGTAKEMRESKDPIVHQFINGLAEGPLTDRRRAGGYETDLLTEPV